MHMSDGSFPRVRPYRAYRIKYPPKSRFRETDLLRHLVEKPVQNYIDEALLVAKGFVVVGSLIKTDASCRVSLAS